MTDKTIQRKLQRDEANRRYVISKSKQSRERWRRLNSILNESYKTDEIVMLNKQMEDLWLADSKGDDNTTWKIIHDLYGKDKKSSVKLNEIDGTPPTSGIDLLAECKEYFSSQLKNSNGQSPSKMPPPAAKALSMQTNLPTWEEILLAIRQCIHQMKTIKAAGLDSAITAEALQNSGDAMVDIVHGFYSLLQSPFISPLMILCSDGRRKYFGSLWSLHRCSTRWCLSAILIHYFSRFPH